MEILSYCFLDENNNILLSNNENININPASNLKIITGYSIYKLLGKNHEFKTNFDIENDSIYISGDPTPLLQFYDLYNISKSLHGNSIIKNVFFDNIYDNKYYGKGWAIEDTKFCYAAKIEPYTVNEVCIPDNFDYTSSKFIKPHDNGMHPYYNNKKLFSEFLLYNINNKNNGNKKNYIYKNNIKDIINHIENVSCNFSIEVILKYLSYNKYGKGTWDKSIEIVNSFIKSFYGNMDNIRIADGSGLSRLNITNTFFISSFINKIYKNDKEFLLLLPGPGKGTLKNRLNKSSYIIYAKTGTLNGCSLLSGFIDNNKISFSIAINNSLNETGVNELKIDNLLLNKLKNL